MSESVDINIGRTIARMGQRNAPKASTPGPGGSESVVNTAPAGTRTGLNIRML